MAIRKVMVTGASGMLGQDLIPFLQAKGYEVIPISQSQLDLLGTQESIYQVIKRVEPEVVVHCAAYTNVDGAERDPELAMAINKDGTLKMALACKNLGVIFAYVSTDFVFDGLKREPYTVHDRPNPISMYGLSKYYGELMVTEQLDQYYIIRTSWLYGIHRNNFVQFVLESARQGKELTIITDQVGSPTWTGSLSATIERVITSGAYGTYHGADAGEISRFDQAKAICKAAGFSTEHIRPVVASDLNLPAARPQYSVLDCGELSVPHWETSLQAYLEQYKSLYYV